MEKYKIYDSFDKRHIGPNPQEINEMLKTIGVNSVEELIEKTIPNDIRLKEDLALEPPMTEYEFLKELKKIASKNQIFDSYIGMGYYPSILPSVIRRNILENPGWYTQYTPYQAEISQGRLEALLNFQTMIIDMTGMQLANASLLDEATAAAEAMTMLYSLRKGNKKDAKTFFVSDKCFPQTIDVLKTRAVPHDINLLIGDYKTIELSDDIFGVLVQYPDSDGSVEDYSDFFAKATEKGIYKAVAADLLSLAILTPPGEFGADVVVGSNQRFGLPMGYGGPHAGYFATKDEYKRSVPGRIIGVSIDRNGNRALRMALQTREQHIKRERATSNICTSQVLLAIMSGMFAVYHGPEGIKKIAERIHDLTCLLSDGLKKLNFKQLNESFFDTLKVEVDSKEKLEKIKKLALDKKINFRYFESNHIGISINETTNIKSIKEILEIFSNANNIKISEDEFLKIANGTMPAIPEKLKRQSKYLTHPVFNSYHSETEMMRYIKNLERKDLSLTTSMIPLGSCTMKLNPATAMLGITWDEFANLHPFCPDDQALGYKELIERLEKQLVTITGFEAVSLQPNSGAQGEFTGLMTIRAYHCHRNEGHRNVILIPSSAHGTNPASAVMAGGKVVVIACDSNGNIDLNDLRKKAEENKDNLSALMVTYPSTHGVFEEEIVEICNIVHQNGGLVYMDGANMNAQVGLTHPAKIGADVCHLNLHKTFAIPHGGGGPGVGPIAVAKHLAPFLPGHSVKKVGGEKAINAVSAAPYGSAGVLVISFAYISMLGTEGLQKATKVAILNANYVMKKLEKEFKVLYTGKNGFVGHELIFDMREYKMSAGVGEIDIAKRLMDFNYHAPTVSFPVAGTLMFEPTESESKAELDRFCTAMLTIKNEINEIMNGAMDKEDNVIKNAPHTAEMVIADNWEHKYSREKAAFPIKSVKDNKFWPSVARIDDAYGDRNLVCSCLPIEEYKNV